MEMLISARKLSVTSKEHVMYVDMMLTLALAVLFRQIPRWTEVQSDAAYSSS